MTTHHSPAPGVAQTPTKALIAAVCLAVAMTLQGYFAGTNELNLQDILRAVVSAALGGYLTWQVPNSAKTNHDQH